MTGIYRNEILSLPFVADIAGENGLKRCFWNVSTNEGEPFKASTGSFYAEEALAYMLKHNAPYLLGWCVMDMPREDKFSAVEAGFLRAFARYAMMVGELPKF
jgi:hypothetical protein